MTTRPMFAISVLLAAGALTSCAGPSIRAVDASGLIGRPAPAWGRLEWLQAGERLRLSDLRGRVVVLHWWTDGCPDCVTNVAVMQQLHRLYSSRGLSVIGMYFPQPRGKRIEQKNLQKVTQLLNIQFPVAVDEDWDVLDRYWLHVPNGGVLTPTFIIDKSGVIRAIDGGRRISAEGAGRMESLIVKLLNEPAS